MVVEEAKKRLQGVAVAAVTQMNQDYSLDLEGIKEFIKFLISKDLVAGNAVILSNGAGGEQMHLTDEEQKQVTRAVVEAAEGKVPIIAVVPIHLLYKPLTLPSTLRTWVQLEYRFRHPFTSLTRKTRYSNTSERSTMLPTSAFLSITILGLARWI
jgi:hypothetical protein